MKTTTHKNLLKLGISILAVSISMGTYAQQGKASASPKANGKVKVIQIINGDTTTFERDFLNSDEMTFIEMKDFDKDFFKDSSFKDIESLKDLHLKFSKDFNDLDSLKDLHMMLSKLPKHKMIVKKFHGDIPDVDSLLKSINMDVDIDMKDFDKHCKIIIKSDKDGKVNFSDSDKFFDKDAEVIVKGDTTIISKKVIIKIVDPSKKDLKKQKVSSFNSQKLNLGDVNVYPNPGNGEFSLVFNLQQKGNTTITVTDINGKEVFRENLKDFSGNYFNQINLGKEPNGIYFLNVEQNGKQVIKKMIKQ